MEISSPLAEMLRSWRAHKHITQQELATVIGIGASTLCRLELGRGGISAANMLRVMLWLVGDVETNE